MYLIVYLIKLALFNQKVLSVVPKFHHKGVPKVSKHADETKMLCIDAI